MPVEGARLVSGEQYDDGGGGPWTPDNNPHFVNGDVIIPEGKTLTIHAGTEIKFGGPFKISVLGNLRVFGEHNNKVIFTSLASDQTDGGRIYWNTIEVQESGHADIDFAVIEYATTGVTLFSPLNNIWRSTIQKCYFGLTLDSSPYNSIKYNEILYTQYDGITLLSSSYNRIHYNTIYTYFPSDFTDNYDGVVLSSSSNNNFKENVIKFHDDGVFLNHLSNDNEFINNVINQNSNHGIHVKECSGTVIQGNTFYANVQGVLIEDSSGTVVDDNVVEYITD
jgi:parallel beta-helix repeat protein